MATENEQLIETRKAIIEAKMAGKPESAKHRALRDIGIMKFADHADFMSFVNECAGVDTETEPEVNEDKLDEIMSYLSPTNGYTKKYVPKAGEASEAEIDELFGNMRL